MSEHTVHAFDDELSAIRNLIAEMGGIAEQAVKDSMTALKQRNVALAEDVIARDSGLDDMQSELEERAIQTIAKRQPMARDLREIVSAIQIAADIERIGDLAKNTAKRTLAISETVPRAFVTGLSRMSDLAMVQLKEVLDSYASADSARALQVWRADEELDGQFNSIFRELLTYMMEDPRNISLCTHLLFCAKNLERIGDHSTNIAENVCYVIDGQAIKVGRPKRDLNTAIKDKN